MRVNYVIVFVSNMQRSVEFYRDVLGIPVRFQSPGWTELATQGATIALHASAATSAEKADADSGAPEPPGRCRPGLRVPDLDAFHHRMTEHHVPCTQPPREVFGARIAQYLDPDGRASPSVKSPAAPDGRAPRSAAGSLRGSVNRSDVTICVLQRQPVAFAGQP